MNLYFYYRCKKIKKITISKELGMVLRNFNEEERKYIIPKVSTQISHIMNKYGFKKISKYAKIFDGKLSEWSNAEKIVAEINEFNPEEMKDICSLLYAKLIYDNQNIDEKLIPFNVEDFENVKEYSKKLADKICSDFIVLDVNYNNLYLIMNKYYSLNKEFVRMNWTTKKFVNNIIKFMNIIFLMKDNHKNEDYFNYKICELENYDFEISDFASFYDGHKNNNYEDYNISKYLLNIDSSYIDSYIKNNKENLNNFIFLISKLNVNDDEFWNFNYREYNLNLISILGLLLVNSKDQKEIKNKFIKNITLCMLIKNQEIELIREKSIINSIYNYRSSILHGNYSGYTNAITDLEKLLEYKPKDYEESKFDTIDFLISKKLNMYISNVFKVISTNYLIVKELKE